VYVAHASITEIPHPQTWRHPTARTFVAVLLCVIIPTAAGQSTATRPSEKERRPTVALTLPEAIQMAMQHNRHLQLAQLGTADAEQKKFIARSDYYPHIKNESMAVHLTSLEGVVIPAGAFAQGASTGLVPSQTVRIGQGGADAFTSGTGLVQPITQLLRVHAGVRAATADVNISRLDASDAENAIALLVHKMYYAILIRQMQLSATEESIQAAMVTDQENTQAVAEGRALDLLKLESHASLLELKQSSLTQQLAIDDLNMQFDDILGLSLGIRLKPDADQLGAPPTLPSEDEAVAQLKSHNIKVLSARQTVEKARAAVSAAKLAYIPNISGMARYSYQSGVPFLVHNFGTFGGVVFYDLFDGGAREARLRQAKIELHIAEIQLTQTESDVSVELLAAYDEIEKLEHLLVVVSEIYTVRQEAARVSHQRLQQSAALTSEVSRSLAAVASAKASVLEATLGLSLAQNKVKQLLGQLPN